jgi:acylphosphatase
VTRPESGAVHAVVRGRVQGVGFRYSAIREARRLGLRGMVRNLGDGSVEVIAEGGLDALDSLLEWLRRGPPGAFVRGVEAIHVPPSGQYEDFEVEY